MPPAEARFAGACLGLLLALAVGAPASELTNAPGPPSVGLETLVPPEDLLRAYLRVQEQLHATQLALEQNRQETLAAAMRTADSLSERLAELEDTLQRQHRAELAAARAANRMILLAAGLLAALGVGAMVASAWLQTRAVRRLSETVAHPPWLSLGGPIPAVPGSGGPPWMLSPSGPATDRSLVDLIERLEQRIAELERSARASLPAAPSAPPSEPSVALPGAALVEPPSSAPTASPARAGVGEAAADVPALLREAEQLLENQDAGAALACYERVLARQPDHAEAWLQKGSAHERLGQTTEALACYERAAATPSARTRAYVRKGALLNSLERYTEALECFEQARRAQETSRAPA